MPNVEFNIALLKEFEVEPKALVPTATIGFPLPIWDQNKGNIMSAEAALIRATEESHRVEMNLTQTFSTNFNNYKTNLQALDYYRNHILPDQVRAYRGVLERRQLDPNAAFSDLFGAQQTLAGFVTQYLSVLGTLWSSSVSVADMLQTDDIFQLAQAPGRSLAARSGRALAVPVLPSERARRTDHSLRNLRERSSIAGGGRAAKDTAHSARYATATQSAGRRPRTGEQQRAGDHRDFWCGIYSCEQLRVEPCRPCGGAARPTRPSRNRLNPSLSRLVRQTRHRIPPFATSQLPPRQSDNICPRGRT